MTLCIGCLFVKGLHRGKCTLHVEAAFCQTSPLRHQRSKVRVQGSTSTTQSVFLIVKHYFAEGSGQITDYLHDFRLKTDPKLNKINHFFPPRN